MKTTRMGTMAAVMGAVVLVLGCSGCELMVELDRSAVDAGEAGCNICSDGAFEDGGVGDGGDAGDASDASRDVAVSTDAPADAAGTDAAGAETSTIDAPAGG